MNSSSGFTNFVLRATPCAICSTGDRGLFLTAPPASFWRQHSRRCTCRARRIPRSSLPLWLQICIYFPCGGHSTLRHELRRSEGTRIRHWESKRIRHEAPATPLGRINEAKLAVHAPACLPTLNKKRARAKCALAAVDVGLNTDGQHSTV